MIWIGVMQRIMNRKRCRNTESSLGRANQRNLVQLSQVKNIKGGSWRRVFVGQRLIRLGQRVSWEGNRGMGLGNLWNRKVLVSGRVRDYPKTGMILYRVYVPRVSQETDHWMWFIALESVLCPEHPLLKLGRWVWCKRRVWNTAVFLALPDEWGMFSCFKISGSWKTIFGIKDRLSFWFVQNVRNYKVIQESWVGVLSLFLLFLLVDQSSSYSTWCIPD